MTTIVFACVHNAGRSQMAAAWLNHLAARRAAGSPEEDRRVVAVSAGTTPAAQVHPEVIQVMREVGIDLSSARPQALTADLVQGARLLVTMGCGDQCPYVPGLEIEDWPIEDPKGQPVERVREIRDEIRSRVERLLQRF
jgi:arsenate reductase (thioredoxin)